MTRIIVKNGDWDKACAELGDVMAAKKNSFDAQFEAAFGAQRKPATAEPTSQPARDNAALAKQAPAKAPGVILSRPRSR